MIFLNSKHYKKLDLALNKAIEESDSMLWKKALNESYSDGFLNILRNERAKNIIQELGYEKIEDLLMNIESYTEDCVNPRIEGDEAKILHKSMFIYEQWEILKKNIFENLNSTRMSINIPEIGGLLVYVGGVSLCLVIKFDRKNRILRIIEVINNPQSAFDFWGIIKDADVKNKNILKEIINTGHKLIYHRGVLIHVDRRKDLQVFGPSIDTLIMNEILIQKFVEEAKKVKSALEIGCGNGLLSVSIAKYLTDLEYLETIDLNFNAVFCTHKNLKSNLTDFEFKSKNSTIINGTFNPDILRDKYDLIISNPPYIPLRKSDEDLTLTEQNYYTAVGGLKLVDKILSHFNQMLTKNGILYLLTSHLSYTYILNKLGDDYIIDEPLGDGHEVLFDVEAVLNIERWLKYLIEEHELIEREEIFYHNIHALLINQR